MERRTVFTPQRFIPAQEEASHWQKHLEDETDPAGFVVKGINENIGKGVFTEKKIPSGSFLLEYHGELITYKEAVRREKEYPKDYGSYLLFFRHRRKLWCIDATFSNNKGRYINDGTGEFRNADLKVVTFKGKPHIVLFASRNIKRGEEIRFDYGVPELPWRLNAGENKGQVNSGTECKECIVLLEKCDSTLALGSIEYEKEDGTYADINISNTFGGHKALGNLEGKCDQEGMLAKQVARQLVLSSQHDENNPKDLFDLHGDFVNIDYCTEMADEETAEETAQANSFLVAVPVSAEQSVDDSVVEDTEKVDLGNSQDEAHSQQISSVTASQTSLNPVSHPKPHRPCPFCFCDKSALTKHLMIKHSDQEEVKFAMSLPKQERNRAFLLLKRKGIMQKNMRILRSNNENKEKLIIERKLRTGKEEKVVYCSKCFGFFTKGFFHRHRRTCYMNESSTNVPMAVTPQETYSNKRTDAKHEAFESEILGSLLSDDVGNICKNDKLIKEFGKQKFNKAFTRKGSKYDDKKATIRTEMRRLGCLYLEFKNICHSNHIKCDSTMDMVKRTNFPYLSEAIDSMTIGDDGNMKDGLRKDVGYVIKRFCNFLHGLLSVKNEDAMVSELDRFVDVLNHYWPEVFGESEYSLNIKRQTQLRKPHNLPKKEEVQKLRDFTLEKLGEMTADKYKFVASNEYTLLRDLVVSRLTLFNARRGGEPSCLLLDQWNDAEEDSWIGNKQSIKDPVERALIGRFKITYQPGKGGKLVPLLILEDCWAALRILCDTDIRKQASIHPENKYVFPMTRFSSNHVSGWRSVSEICSMAKLQKKVTATNMRHYIATLYASLELTEAERETFYAHMGHSADINKHVYQSPLARQEIIKVGKFLEDVDMGKHPTSCLEPGTSQNTQPIQPHYSDDIKQLGKEVRNQSLQNNDGIIYTRVRVDQDSDDDSVNDPDYSVNADDESTDSETTDDESDLEINEEETPYKKKRQYSFWGKDESNLINEYFRKYILSTENVKANTGSLPGVKKLKAFLTKYPSIKADIPEKERIYRLKSKIFNERKLVRDKLRKSKGQLKCSPRKQKT